MDSHKSIKSTLTYTVIIILSFLTLQAILIVMHEFTHSITAYLLGDADKPFSIIWGNCVMMTGWDEGVHYHKLFPLGGNWQESTIGGMPLLMHTIMVSLGIFILTRKHILKHKWTYHFIYWFIIANMMELIAYIVMRAFAPNGDTGHFNRGLGISPWILFIIGSALIIIALCKIYTKLIPNMYTLFADSNIHTQWVILMVSTFAMFLWGSGLRIVLYIYPNPQWLFGLIGFAAFVILVLAFKPRNEL